MATVMQYNEGMALFSQEQCTYAPRLNGNKAANQESIHITSPSCKLHITPNSVVM